jgi:hypothetical protein
MLTLVLMAVSLILVLDLALPEVNSPIDVVGDILNLATGQLDVSDFFNNLFDLDTGVLTTIGATGVIILGLFAATRNENYLILGFIVAILLVLVGSFSGVLAWMGNPDVATENWKWVSASIKIFMALFIVSYVITLVEFFRSNI